MSNSQLSAFRNMPIFIKKCNVRAGCMAAVEGRTPDFEQILVLRDYMKLVVCQNG